MHIYFESVGGPKSSLQVTRTRNCRECIHCWESTKKKYRASLQKPRFPPGGMAPWTRRRRHRGIPLRLKPIGLK